jgi:hypothetical protein
MGQNILENLLAFSIFTFLTIVKLHSNSLIQAIARITSKRFRHPDDAAFFGKQKGIADGVLAPLDQTGQRIWQNDIENIYPYLFVGVVFSLSGPMLMIQITYFTIFLLTRILHSVFLIFPKQPHRNIFYQGGNVITMVTILHTIWNLYHLSGISLV